jgi:hypothetical protein
VLDLSDVSVHLNWGVVFLFDRMPSGLRKTCCDNLGIKEDFFQIPIMLFKI